MGVNFGLTRTETELLFWARVQPNLNTGCWEWERPSRTDGYGTMRSRFFGKEHLAHRVAYVLENGPIPQGLHIRHKCDNRRCVFPNHLEIGTALDNSHDCERRGRRYHPRGADHYQSQFTRHQVLEIRARYTGVRGELKALAQEYGVHPVTISDIITRRTFKWISAGQLV